MTLVCKLSLIVAKNREESRYFEGNPVVTR